MSTIFSILQVALASNGVHIKLPEIQIPHDVRTAYHIHSSEPDIIWTSCCPKCYTIYTGRIPLCCSWKESPCARVCDSELWRLQQFGRNPRSVPKTLYNTQNFESWLKFLQQAQAWHNMTTKVDCQRQATATGVRWTFLHHLPYRDPVRHTILGFMHNWLEGILQYQLQKLWGIGRDNEAEKSLVSTNQEESYSQSDISESGDELEELRKKAIEAASGTLDLPPPSSPSASTESGSSTPRATPVPRMDISMYSDDEPDGPEDSDYLPNYTQASFDFAKDQLKRIQHCIQYATSNLERQTSHKPWRKESWEA